MRRLENVVRRRSGQVRDGHRRPAPARAGRPGQARRTGRAAALLAAVRVPADGPGDLELSEDGKAMKYFELVPFEMRITAETVVRALAEDDGKDALHMEERDQ